MILAMISVIILATFSAIVPLTSQVEMIILFYHKTTDHCFAAFPKHQSVVDCRYHKAHGELQNWVIILCGFTEDYHPTHTYRYENMLLKYIFEQLYL